MNAIELYHADGRFGHNWRYKKAVTAACAELEEMQAPTPTWPDHAAVIITKHLTPLFRHLAMGHAHSDTTLGYCHASALSVPSPLEAFA